MNVLPSVAQQPLSAVDKTEWDVIIVGGGPAGASAAASLAACGVKVLLVDRARFPREKVCGDGLVPESMHALQRLGIAEEVRRHATTFPNYTLVSPTGTAVTMTSEVSVLQRQVLDTLLCANAVSRGATFVQGAFSSAEPRADGDVDCVINGNCFRSRVLILAPGADLSSLKSASIKRNSEKPNGVAIRRYYRSSAGPDRPYFFLRKGLLPGYGWIFPMGSDQFNIGCGRFLSPGQTFPTSLIDAFEEFLTEEPIARRLTLAGEPFGPVRGASLRCGMRSFEHAQQGRILFAGEAIGTTIPGWGEGISKAMETGLLAAEVTNAALRANDFSLLECYGRRLAAEIKPEITRHRRVTCWFDRPWTADLLVALVRLLPRQCL